MGSIKYKLGDLIELSDNKNNTLYYGIDNVKGISIQKSFIETKADMNGVALRSYYMVKPDDFAYVTVTSRNGEKITLAHNTTKNTYIVSSSYIVFSVKRKDLLLSDYLFMYFNRPEFDRYSRFNSWGSARETFSWSEMCDIALNLPPLPVQQRYIDIYCNILVNQKGYECGLSDLKLSFDAIIDNFKYSENRILLGDAIEEIDVRNEENIISVVHGVNKEKQFMPSVASGADLSKYKIVNKGQFACNLMHVGRDVAVPVALYKGDKPIIVSPAYFVFQLKTDRILPEYAMMWFSRNETDRYAWFLSDTNVRSGMEKKRFCEIEIPVPDIEKQKALVNIYNVYMTRHNINEKLKIKIKEICPILIKGSLEQRNECK